jgi:hypothetical protein
MNDNTHSFGNKPKMNVFIPTGNTVNGDTVYKAKLKNGEYEYSGFIWDVWQNIKNRYAKKYEIIETFGDQKDYNYTELITHTQQGKYDLIIYPFVHTEQREKKINFSLPIYVDPLSVSYSKKTTLFNDFTKVLGKSGKLLFILLFAGICSGILLNTFDTKRGLWLPQIKQVKGRFVHPMRNFLTGFAAVLGEMGFLAENVGLTTSGILVSMFVMVFSFIFVMLIQAQFTRALIEVDNDDYSFNKPLLTLEGYPAADKIKNYGGALVHKPGADLPTLIKEYNNNKHKYGGLVLLYGHIAPFINDIDDNKTHLNYGHELCSFIVNDSRRDVLEDVNVEIVRLTHEGELKKICETHFTGNLAPLCSLN